MKKIIVNHEPWQTRIAVLHNDGSLQNIYFSSPTTQTLERSFFKGVVAKVLPGIQTSFVDIGQEKAGFLHISEIDRTLAIKRMAQADDDEVDDDEESKEPIPTCALDIDKIFHEGEHILVQVSKEPVYEKGPKLTTCFTLPGRFLVLMPNIPRIGVSKKIENQEERRRLRTAIRAHLPPCMGAIVRTTCEGRTEKELSHEIQYLVAQWHEIERKFKEAQPKTLIFHDIDLLLQIVRDNLDDEVESIIVDDKKAHNDLYAFVKQMAPEYAFKVMFFDRPGNIFETYGVEKEIERALDKKVQLKSGGSIIIESTEAMTVVDVNTGKYLGSKHLEDTIYATNLEAAEEVVRQLRLRNIGGIIVIDFIDMTSNQHRQNLFRTLERLLRERDKFQSVVLRVSEFGIVQMTRKRTGKTLVQQLMRDCQCCKGTGFEKSVQAEAFTLLKQLRTGLLSGRYKNSVRVEAHRDVFHYLIGTEYDALLQLEKTFKVKILLVAHESSDKALFVVG